MPAIARVPITNIYTDGQYTARILVGPQRQPMNVLLDTGSGPLALDTAKYAPDLAGGDKTTLQAQTRTYGDGSSWTGAVIQTAIALGDGGAAVSLQRANVAVAYDKSANMFGSTDGILGLAYAALDDAIVMPNNTWKQKYSNADLQGGRPSKLAPYLAQLAGARLVANKFSFLTRRSLVHAGGGGAEDPLNQGWLIVGGGEESVDLYAGPFSVVKVLADDWYNTELKAVVVGGASPIVAPPKGPAPSPTNSAIDSGNTSLCFAPDMLQALMSKFSAPQQALLNRSLAGGAVSVADLNLATWPDIVFILQGDAGADVRLTVKASDYWQVNAPQAGQATAAISAGIAGMNILGLPLMNGYFTVFDRSADGGGGVIRFAAAVR
jgi:hypothetical protein